LIHANTYESIIFRRFQIFQNSTNLAVYIDNYLLCLTFSLEDMALGLLSSTLEKTTKIAAGAYHMAKDVYHTLQAKSVVSIRDCVQYFCYMQICTSFWKCEIGLHGDLGTDVISVDCMRLAY
jgi:hypothetical protein